MKIRKIQMIEEGEPRAMPRGGNLYTFTANCEVDGEAMGSIKVKTFEDSCAEEFKAGEEMLCEVEDRGYGEEYKLVKPRAFGGKSAPRAAASPARASKPPARAEKYEFGEEAFRIKQRSIQYQNSLTNAVGMATALIGAGTNVKSEEVLKVASEFFHAGWQVVNETD